MIVACPSCRRRYRHEFQLAQLAHCGACDERFEPAPPRRQYVLVPGGPIPAAGRIPAAAGLDDPLLGETVGVSSDPVPSACPGPVPATDSLLSATDEAGPESQETAAVPESQFGPRVTKLLEASVAVVPCGLGAGLAYYFSGSLNQDPIISAILGGVTGLLLGWACVLWIAQAD